MQCPLKIQTPLAFGCLISFFFPCVNWKSPTFLKANLPLSFLILLNLGKVKSVTGLGPENIKCYIVIWNSLLSYWCCPCLKFHHFLSPPSSFFVTSEIRLFSYLASLLEHLCPCGVICGWGPLPLDFLKQGLWRRFCKEWVCVPLR